ncbi:LacI family DNA-binding transcriptional regulator [Actinoallomurus soli]|uniref:LacI family DNA-binding transcriptional regulator n=1 Tax=Actinoallomurus soli TaxID=2952535 RepID=UPI0020924257|nr:LacI family DNA-binding transcriptional regulator [Actinoallomurus soli]MCO5970577.1 LacI family transcriptional regulator [Actinoallomurus soli]
MSIGDGEWDEARSGPVPRPRMQDIAVVLGVSIKTVSRALSGAPNVRESTRERVLAEAARLGFRRNDIAAGLRSTRQTMKTIGVVLGDLANPFFPPMLQGIHSVAARHGHLVISADSQGDSAVERESIQTILAQRVAGLIISPTGTDFSYLAQESEFGSAIVFIDSAPLGLTTDAVITTNTASTRHAVAHLIGRGHRRIGYIGHPPQGYGAPKRWLGYCQALRHAGIEVDAALVRRGLTTEADAARAATELLALPDPPTALFADNNRMTIGILQSPRYAACHPEVVGFDHFDLAPQLGISVVDSDPFRVGSAGAELLFRRLADRERAPTQTTVRAKLIVHDQPAFAPVRSRRTR